jgi:ribonuclease G
MSDAFESAAEPATPALSDPAGTAGPNGQNDLSPASAAETNSIPSDAPTGAEGDAPPTRARRAPRRTGTRTRKTAPSPEPVVEAVEAVVAAPEPPAPAEAQEAAPAPAPPRRRRSRKAAPPVEAQAVEAQAAEQPAATPLSVEAAPVVIPAPPGELSPSLETMTGDEPAEPIQAALTGAPDAPSLSDGEPATIDADQEASVDGEEAALESGEGDADGQGARRRRSRRGSRGGRRSRSRRAPGENGAAEAESDEAAPDAVAAEAVAAEASPAEPAAATRPPEFETPLPDVMVHFRPVAKRPAGPSAAAGPSAGELAPPTEAGESPEVTEGEPTSRGRRRRRRGERGERPSGTAAEREDRPSGVGGALPPRGLKPEPVAEPVEPAPEAAVEKPKVERAGRGQRGDRVLERAVARAEREATKVVDRDVERVTKEIVINVSPRETRIAVLENGRLVELHVEREERVVGSVYKGRVANVLPGMDAAFVDIGLDRNAFLYVGDILFEGGEESAPVQKRSRDMRIRDVARPGQEILAQVVKGPRGTKGARVSTRMSLPGRYIVLMPDAENLGVSRKIEDPAERDRLKRIGEKLRPGGFGMIIRTEAEERTEAELRQDLDMLVHLWQQISTKSKQAKAPALIHQDLSLILKTIRDVFGADVDKLLIDSEDDYSKVREMLAILSPDLMDRVEPYAEPEPIFSRFGLEDEIERLLRRKVWLKSGGYITIDASEALTAIDVNTGKFVGSTSLSDTILKTNLDAVQEIARQLRLRDIGGMIVLDFIDMNSARDRAQVMAALDKALKKDRTRTKVAHISPLGLIEMTRKRTGETVTELITQTCDYCQGRGRTLSPETVSIQIERAVRRKCSEGDFDAILVHAHPEVCAHLIGPEGENVEAIERLLRRPIYVRARHDFHLEKYEILPGDMMEIEKGLLPYRGGQVVECDVQKLELIAAPRSAAWVNGYFVDLANGTRFQGARIRVRLTDVRRSFALGEPVAPATSVDKSEPI